MDGSGEVNAGDLKILVNSFLGRVTCSETDLDHSGCTDAVDYQLLVRHVLGHDIDSDGDGLTNLAEEQLGTDPDNPDHDGDGLSDGEELVVHQTDPLQPDTDEDGVNDGQEVYYEENPLSATADYLVINEFVASNDIGLTDEDGDEQDWIELYNAGNTPVMLEGWSLTDKKNHQLLFYLPAITLPAKSYLVVFASNKDRAPVNGQPIHTDFKLSKGGEYLALCDPSGGVRASTCFSPSFPKQYTDISYGRSAQREGCWYFSVPTPGAPNDEKSRYAGFMKSVEFSSSSDFHTNPFLLSLSCGTNGAEIRYTLDGTIPTQGTGYLYNEAIPIASSTVVSACAYRSDFMNTEVCTQSYIFNPNAVESALPILSLVGNPQETFYEPNGIMGVSGGVYLPSSGWLAFEEGDYNNALLDPDEIVRPISVEVFNHVDTFSANAMIKLHGNLHYYNRRTDGPWDDYLERYSFRLCFEDTVSELECELFPDSDIESYEQLVMRSGNTDHNPFIKDEFSRRIFLDMGQCAARGDIFNLYINGEYKGYVNLAERCREDFFQQFFDSDKDWERIDGEDPWPWDPDDKSVSFSHWKRGLSRCEPSSASKSSEKYTPSEETVALFIELIDIVRNQDCSLEAVFTDVASRLDIVAFIDYIILNLYLGNLDWPYWNWNFAREKAPGSKFIPYAWDLEYGMTAPPTEYNGLRSIPYGPVGEDGGLLYRDDYPLAWLFQGLYKNESFRQQFAERVRVHFYNDGALTDAHVQARYQELSEIIDDVLPDMDTYPADVFLPNRRAFLLRTFSDEGLFHPLHPNITIEEDMLSLSNPNGSGIIYYTLDGSDPMNAPVSAQVALVDQSTPSRFMVPSSVLDFQQTGQFATTLYRATDILKDLYNLAFFATEMRDPIKAQVSTLNFSSTGSGGHYPNALPFPGMLANESPGIFVTDILGKIVIPTAGTYTFNIHTDEYFYALFFAFQDMFTAPLEEEKILEGTAQDNLITVEFQEPGVYSFLINTWNEEEEAILEVSAAPGEHTAFDESVFRLVGDTAGGGLAMVKDWYLSDYDDTTWTGASGALGFDNGSGEFAPFIDTDISASMLDINSNCYMRIPFTLSEAEIAQLKHLTLYLRYNDEVSILLNGKEILWNSLLVEKDWDAPATEARSITDSLQEIRYPCTHLLSCLKEGENILAVRGTNLEKTDPNFLLKVSLVAEKEIAPTAQALVADSSISLEQACTINARVCADGIWSPLESVSYMQKAL